MGLIGLRACIFGLAVLALPSSLLAQAAGDPHAGMHHDQGSQGWQFMQDGALFLMFNAQGGPRGETEIKAPNWWMGMARHSVGRGSLTVNLMLSLDPATVGAQGYSEIFQVGETFNGVPLIDHQHPHDFLMQAAAVYRLPLWSGVALTLAGAPVGEPALGPVAFMHRLSSFENPIAPLSHHTLDSTHVAMGVLTGSIDRGPIQVEASTFHGAEPDEQRWDLMDPGPLDSWSVRGWFRPSPSWSFQVSHGFLKQPEAAEEGDVGRTTVSGSWTRRRDESWTAVTAAWGRNHKIGGNYNAFLLEGSHAFGQALTVYGRAEHDQVETDVLRFGDARRPGRPEEGARRTARHDRLRVDADPRRQSQLLEARLMGLRRRRGRHRLRRAGAAPADPRRSSDLVSPVSASPCTLAHRMTDDHDDQPDAGDVIAACSLFLRAPFLKSVASSVCRSVTQLTHHPCPSTLDLL